MNNHIYLKSQISTNIFTTQHYQISVLRIRFVKNCQLVYIYVQTMVNILLRRITVRDNKMRPPTCLKNCLGEKKCLEKFKVIRTLRKHL